MADGVNMTLESVQNFHRNSSSGLLVGIHLSIKDMNRLDDSPVAKAIMFLP